MCVCARARACRRPPATRDAHVRHDRGNVLPKRRRAACAQLDRPGQRFAGGGYSDQADEGVGSRPARLGDAGRGGEPTAGNVSASSSWALNRTDRLAAVSGAPQLLRDLGGHRRDFRAWPQHSRKTYHRQRSTGRCLHRRAAEGAPSRATERLDASAVGANGRVGAGGRWDQTVFVTHARGSGAGWGSQWAQGNAAPRGIRRPA